MSRPAAGDGPRTPLLDGIEGPEDLRALPPSALPALAAELRDVLVTSVTRTGGHLGPNLGVVELTIALHRVFHSPDDRVLWDTGHQSYVHKLLTGRKDFTGLRSRGGLSGYPSRAESEHDVIENSHASTALSYADGLARAVRLRGAAGRHVAAVIGDGALTGGMAWEALNNIATSDDLPLVIVVNDNGRSYAPTRGGLARHLTTLRTTQGYERFLSWGKEALQQTPMIGGPLFQTLHGAKKGLKDLVAPQGLFEDLGLKYVGPVDGHDVDEVERALRRARAFGGPVIVHCVTTKGKGYAPAEQDEADCFHAVGAAPSASAGGGKPAGRSWTSVFSEEMVKVGAEREDVVAITAAMLQPVGLGEFADLHPERVLDVGIAEQHAVTSAAGLAAGGLHPVVAVYATFLNRAFDQVLMDVALHRAPVTFVLDRAGATGSDGASHNGMWDLSVLQVVPGLQVAAPRDAVRLRRQLREALAVSDGPTVVRFPKGNVGADVEAVETVDGVDVLARPEGEAEVLIVAVGALAGLALETADRLAEAGVAATVVDPCWVKPVNPALVKLADRHRLVVTLEDNGVVGGVGAAVAREVEQAGVRVPVRTCGLAQTFFEHGSRGQVLAESGLTAENIAGTVGELLSATEAPAQPTAVPEHHPQRLKGA
ncbi:MULTISPECIES: 1-deoxy-D-xylulose-5-phosphate synthase [unclassified Streptomyces]|uniref:1-deoxy-D-xylulose-5-phosphate synthase n=1 Tax=unclassified Streptomyces TaxID=2593676 RepID=UPI0022B70876|nr:MULTISPECIES: 1-deoxy-D-xylulose-5-phosphate synthase [unclassified Streptomyces]MCZ7414547.1 1-deoxy-D-xylulose-5-phosphate synthase [Streptomyces sp. WMMC897]MCZ7431474.1 1-deoxy-D-xylulose-5-phosphate synthase [Streptomyces sp. WMMC1477]